MTKMHVIHMLVCFIYLKIESGVLVPSMSTVWEDIVGCAEKYMYALAIYLITVCVYLYL